jgi:acyl-CoA thioesterase I
VAFGDSITYGYGGTISYPQYLAGLMPSTTIINKGIKGDSTGGMLRQFQADVIASAPQYVIILGGLNDFNQNTTFDTTTANLQSMYTQALENGIKPVLCTILPVSGFPTSQKSNIGKLNGWISGYASSHGLPLADLYGAMQDPAKPGNLNPSYDSGDGLHPNNAGYERIANTIYNAAFAH